MPKVSIIIPCYNQGAYIEEAIESVLNQTFQDFEIIVVNDGSTDNFTNNLLKNFNKPKTQVIHTTNQGVATARNTGIKQAKGEYILPLDADDKIVSTYLEKAVKVLDKNPQIGIVYSEAMLFGEKNKKWNLPEYKFPQILIGNCIFNAAFFRKSDWLKTKGYNPEMIYGLEDWEFWISLIELGIEVYRIPEVLFFYHKKKSSISTELDYQKRLYSLQKIFELHPKLYSKNLISIIESLYSTISKLLNSNNIIFKFKTKLGNKLKLNILVEKI